jgi:hypothetical protein
MAIFQPHFFGHTEDSNRARREVLSRSQSLFQIARSHSVFLRVHAPFAGKIEIARRHGSTGPLSHPLADD